MSFTLLSSPRKQSGRSKSGAAAAPSDARNRRRDSNEALMKHLRDDFLHHSARDVGQAIVAACVTIGELLVVEAEQMQDRGVEVVDVDFVFGDGAAVFIARSVAEAAADAAAGEP